MPIRRTTRPGRPGCCANRDPGALIAELGTDPPTMILGSNAAIERAVEKGLEVGLISFDAAAAERIS